MLHQEIEIIDGKTLSYVKLNDWCEKVVLFFHDFMGLKEYFPTTGNAKRCLLSFDKSGWGSHLSFPIILWNDIIQEIS
ncbi:hypothetical protein [Streptococcus mutans]|uniref:hypothetical protein n=1 Tax=Streptococcus mutans TaxID=1309 RepID=UPI0002B5F121|nr:hypothetical protein [Streptococcus mutans]EMB68987.1 hypothetical protein SMU29_02451 [Streptococcus mutans 2ST1]EMC38084.1 hypothetical protein SMU93_00608 [Streptococcus mutans 21]